MRGALQLVLAILGLQAICQQKRSSGNGEGESAPLARRVVAHVGVQKEVGDLQKPWPRLRGRPSTRQKTEMRLHRLASEASMRRSFVQGAARRGFKDNTDMDRVDSGLKHNIHHNGKAAALSGRFTMKMVTEELKRTTSH